MTKQQLVDTVAVGSERNNKEIGEVVDSLLTEVTQALVSGERVDLRGFGSFVPKETKARRGRNPQTGEPIQIAAKKTVTFKPAKDLEKSLMGDAVAQVGAAEWISVYFYPSKTAGSHVTLRLRKQRGHLL